MAEQRLPIVDSDDGAWGTILNQYIAKEHYNTGADNAANGGHKTVTLQPGTTAAGTAPLKFATGPLMTAPEAGAVEYLTGQFYLRGTDSLSVAGNIGAGVVSSTAALHIKAGTTAASTAPLKFTSGALTTAAEAGAVEFVTDTLYFTQTTSTTRKKIAAYDDTSGAAGDIYYRDSSGYFVRLAIGSTAGQILNVSSGSLPAWTDLKDSYRQPRITSTASSSTPTPNCDTTDTYILTALAVTATFGAPTGTPVEGRKLIIRIKDSGGVRTLNWNAIYRAGTDIPLPTATVTSKTMYLGFVYNNTDTKWDLVAKVNNI